MDFSFVDSEVGIWNWWRKERVMKGLWSIVSYGPRPRSYSYLGWFGG